MVFTRTTSAAVATLVVLGFVLVGSTHAAVVRSKKPNCHCNHPSPSPTPTASPSATPCPSDKPMPSKPTKPTKPVVDACQLAFDECEFTFRTERDGVVPSFHLTAKPDVPFTSVIVPKSGVYTLGALNTNNIVPEFITPTHNAVPITKFASPHPFTPTHFKPFSHSKTSLSSIGHQTFHGDQHHIAKNKCVRVFFTHFQVYDLSTPRKLLRNVQDARRSDNKCVVFKTL